MTRDSSLWPASDTMGSLLAVLTRQFGPSPQILDDTGATSFMDIDVRSARVAQGLLANGVAKGARIGILMPNGADYPTALFGVLRVGGVAVLLSTVARGGELAYMIRNADVDTLLMVDTYLGHDYVALLEDARPNLRNAHSGTRLLLAEAPFLRSVFVWGAASPPWSAGDEAALGTLADKVGLGPDIRRAAQDEVVPADPGVIIYTSGSTADPKAVMHSQGSLVRQALALSELSDYRPGDRVLSTSPFFWVGGLCTSLLAAMCSGAAVICPEGPSINALIRSLQRWRATHIVLWLQQVELMRDFPNLPKLSLRCGRPSRRNSACTGWPMPTTSPMRWA